MELEKKSSMKEKKFFKFKLAFESIGNKLGLERPFKSQIYIVHFSIWNTLFNVAQN